VKAFPARTLQQQLDGGSGLRHWAPSSLACRSGRNRPDIVSVHDFLHLGQEWDEPRRSEGPPHLIERTDSSPRATPSVSSNYTGGYPDVRIMRRPRRLSARKSAPGGVEFLPFALASPGAGCRGRSGGRSWDRVELRAPNRTPLAVVGCQALPASSRGTRRCRRGRRRRRMRTIVLSAERRCLPGRRADRRNGTRA
jgi:hypothetical protein